MTVPTTLRERVRTMMDAHWRAAGFTVPHASRYPWQWLWDSCFHVLVWLELGEGERAARELTTAMAAQDDEGFVPHITYHGGPSVDAAFWGRVATSSITQPPMYGHALAALVDAGVAVPAELVERVGRAFRFLISVRRRDPSGLVTVVHPWETGCDDSPRFDHWGAADVAGWYEVKGRLVAAITHSAGGAPVANPEFECAPVGFNALLAWNLREFVRAGGDATFAAAADEIAGALDARLDADRPTWVDAGAAGATSGRVRTLDGLLPLLCTRARSSPLTDPGWAGAFGPPNVHREEPAFEPRRYWRGNVWPPLVYLLTRAGATEFGARTRAGAERSGLAEYWDPDDGSPLGAVPQSWAGLALLL